jgi:hypothetical protein
VDCNGNLLSLFGITSEIILEGDGYPLFLILYELFDGSSSELFENGERHS